MYNPAAKVFDCFLLRMGGLDWIVEIVAGRIFKIRFRVQTTLGLKLLIVPKYEE